ncbi:hypothetical protein RJ639_002644 [Escallonia herrerae]|uniref:Peptidase C1A papain C-terminal domain-containing protein n=1 Tax=Escallonia herrerae TaxID=1293975 RepID=A0AA88XAZ3_9ASTE|nr:hypothetical protein RJ639_002644 [Escallonia herrerae]
MSSMNMDVNCSSSNRSNSVAVLDPGAPTAGASRNASESLMDLRWDPRFDDEKSRNSSTHEWFWAMLFLVAKVSIDGILWWCCDMSGQFVVMFGTFGGNCAILTRRCWAFTTTTAMKGINQIKTGKLVELSEQELVNCNVNNEYTFPTDANQGGNLGEVRKYEKLMKLMRTDVGPSVKQTEIAVSSQAINSKEETRQE